MNTAKLATALNTISMGFAEAAEALIEQPQLPPAVKPEGAGMPPAPARVVAGSATPPADTDRSPFEDEAATWQPPDNLEAGTQSERDRVLAECPVHFRAWTIKEGGISKNGRPYSAFWKCNGKNDDGSFCTKKPEAGWVKTHNAEKALAASVA